MRTTITIDDDLLAQVKEAALATGTTVSDFIQEAVRTVLLREQPAPPPFRLVTFGALGTRPGIDLARASALLADDDLDAFGGRGDGAA